MNEQQTVSSEVTAAIAAFVEQVDLSTLSAKATENAHQAIADTVACMLAGSVSELSAPLLAYSDEIGTGPARVVGRKSSASAQTAALLNGGFAAALDFDDLMTPMHPSAVVVAALCAGLGADKVSGRRFTEAYIVGIEIGAKISRALGHGHSKRGFHATSTLSGFSAFAALARLHGMPAGRIVTGLSIVASQSAGVLCQLGTMAKPLHSGLAARVAIDARAMTQHGITAAKAVFEVRRGYFEAYGDVNSNVQLLPGSLGKPWAVEQPGSTLKRFPSSIAGHRGILAVLDLKAQGLTAGNLVKLDCSVAPGALRPMMYPRPKNGIESKFSMPYALATALLDERISISSFETPATQRPEVIALMEKIHAWEDPKQMEEDPVSANLSWGYRGYVRATATLDNGQVLVSRVDIPPGTPSNPLTWADLSAKFLDCAAGAGVPSSSAKHAFDQLQDLDACTDVDALLALLQPIAAVNQGSQK